METLRKTIAAFCAVSFIVTGVVSLLLFNFERRAFTAEIYQKAFAHEDFYNKLPAVMADAITFSGADQGGFPIVIQGMGRDEWETFFRTLLPADALRAMGDDLLNSTFAYLNMETDAAHLNLAPLKASLAGDAGVQVVFSLLRVFPECDLFQIGQITLNLLSGGGIELCNPPADLRPMLVPVIQDQMQFMAAGIPDQVVIINAPPQNDPRQGLQTARLFMRISPLLPMVFLFGILIFGVRSLKDWLNWWGIPLAVTGVIAFLSALLGGPIFGEILQRILLSQMPNYLPAILSDYAGDLASAMVQTLLSPVLWQGLALAFLGTGMAGMYFLVRFLEDRNAR